MKNLLIGVPTYKRPRMLLKLIESLFESHLDPTLIGDVKIIVVDNDPDQTALSAAEQLKKDCPSNFTFEYSNFTKKGLTLVRNHLLDIASKATDFSYFLFIDDDTWVDKVYLTQIIKAMERHKADFVKGSSNYTLSADAPDYLSHWFMEKYGFKDGTQVDFIESNNLLVNLDFIRRTGIRFDMRFNITGGEDTYFGVQAMEQGARIFWSTKAFIYETVPESRANLKWLMKRYFRAASTYIYVLKISKNRSAYVKKFFVSIIYVLVGIISLPIYLLPIKWRYWGAIKIAEGLGGLAGFFSLRYKEYA